MTRVKPKTKKSAKAYEIVKKERQEAAKFNDILPPVEAPSEDNPLVLDDIKVETKVLVDYSKLRKNKNTAYKEAFRGCGVRELKNKKHNLLRKLAFLAKRNIEVTPDEKLQTEQQLAQLEAQILESTKVNMEIQERVDTPDKMKSMKNDKTKIKRTLRKIQKSLQLLIGGDVVSKEEANLRNALANCKEQGLYIHHFPAKEKRYYGLFEKNLTPEQEQRKQEIMVEALQKAKYTRPTYRMSVDWSEKQYVTGDDDNKMNDKQSITDDNNISSLMGDSKHNKDLWGELYANDDSDSDDDDDGNDTNNDSKTKQEDNIKHEVKSKHNKIKNTKPGDLKKQSTKPRQYVTKSELKKGTNKSKLNDRGSKSKLKPTTKPFPKKK